VVNHKSVLTLLQSLWPWTFSSSYLHILGVVVIDVLKTELVVFPCPLYLILAFLHSVLQFPHLSTDKKEERDECTMPTDASHVVHTKQKSCFNAMAAIM